MKMLDFLERIPPHFAQEILESLPAPDRKDLLRRHNAKAKLKAGSLNRAVRAKKEARNLISALKKSDLDSQRTFLQGWLARRADMIVYFLNAWEIEHQNGIVESFDWVDELEVEKVKESLPGLTEMNENLEPIAPLIYFAYLELPCTAEALDVDALIAGVAPAEQAT